MSRSIALYATAAESLCELFTPFCKKVLTKQSFGSIIASIKRQGSRRQRVFVCGFLLFIHNKSKFADDKGVVIRNNQKIPNYSLVAFIPIQYRKMN